VERPDALARLRNAVITDGSGPSIALTALEGMGGIGKTILAQALCHDEVVQQAFPSGCPCNHHPFEKPNPALSA
jgi:DNA replication protein DnaC